MAKVKTSSIIEGLSGKVGADLVFRTMRGKTFISKPAKKRDKSKETEAQRKTRTTFREAAAWASKVSKAAETKAYYEHLAMDMDVPNAYTAALKVYMNKVRKSV